VINAPAALATLRIARRDAWRHKARSVLVVAMVALPVLALTGADILARTMQLNPAQRLDREIGQASVAIQPLGGRVQQEVDATLGAQATGTSVSFGTAAYRTLLARAEAQLPAGSRVVPTLLSNGPVSAGGRLVNADLDGIDLRDPLTRGMADLVSGRAPAAASEVAITPSLAARMAVGVGGQVTLAGTRRSVVGEYRKPGALSSEGLYALPSALSRLPGTTADYLVATAQPISWTQVRAFNAMGIAVTSRYAVEHPPAHTDFPEQAGGDHAELIGIATVAVGLAILEVVLLAGAAFAVGARRQRRDLALISAGGGDAGHVRSVVLAGGLVLGLIGAVAGVAGGVVAARLLLPVEEGLADKLGGRFDVRPLELLAVGVLGVLTGLLASVLPARSAAREDVVAALTGRRGIVTTARRIPVAGLSMAVLGFVIAAYAAHPPARFTLILVGAVVSELGFVVCSPGIVGLAGRLARFAPLAPRLALRDAARHRARTGPAVAAIMAAVAGSIAVSTYIVSEVASERANYQPQSRIGQPLLFVGDPNPAATRRNLATATAIARTDLGASAVVPMPTSTCASGRSRCAFLEAGSDPTRHLDTPDTLAVGDATLLTRIAGRSTPAAVAALQQGKVVAFDSGWVDQGDVSLSVEGQGDRSRREQLPAYSLDVGDNSAATGAIISPALATRLHLTLDHNAYIVVTQQVPSQAQQDRADAALQPTAANQEPPASLSIERGYHPERWNYGLIALAAAAAIVTLGATGITTGLSAAESRPDLTTLSAVGSSPRTRRLLVANQAGTVALLGTVVGVVSGLVPAYGVLRSRSGFPFVLPWETIGVVVVGVPLLAMLATALFVSTRSTMPRRAT
jgi:putative ABC transport system permease protein